MRGCQHPKGEPMTTKLNRLVLCLILAGLTASWAVAQSETSDSKSKSDVRTVTGCLTKGDSADEFVLTGNDGRTCEAPSSKIGVHRATQLGHTVSATEFGSHAIARHT